MSISFIGIRLFFYGFTYWRVAQADVCPAQALEYEAHLRKKRPSSSYGYWIIDYDLAGKKQQAKLFCLPQQYNTHCNVLNCEQLTEGQRFELVVTPEQVRLLGQALFCPFDVVLDLILALGLLGLYRLLSFVFLAKSSNPNEANGPRPHY